MIEPIVIEPIAVLEHYIAESGHGEVLTDEWGLLAVSTRNCGLGAKNDLNGQWT